MQAPYHETRKRQHSQMTAAELAAEMDRLEAKLDRADALIAEALRPEPIDWQRHYTELFAEAAEAGRKRAARMEGGTS